MDVIGICLDFPHWVGDNIQHDLKNDQDYLQIFF